MKHDAVPTGSELLASLRAATRTARAKAVQQDRPTAEEMLGLTVGEIRTVTSDAARRLRGADPRVVLDLADALVETGVHEARLVGYEVVSRHRRARESLDRTLLERLGRGIDNWVAVDSFGGWLSGPSWLRGQIADKDVRVWARSRDLWWRRVALVSTTTLNKKSKGGTGDTRRTLDICGRLAADHEDMIVKAVSWALRELVPWDADGVGTFLEANEDALAARVLREVRNKLRTGHKNPR